MRTFGLCIALLATLGLGYGARISRKVKKQEAETNVTAPSAKAGAEGNAGYASCSALCQSSNSGNGRMIGTSPFCSASCAECTGTCQIVVKADGFSDYGAGCWSGDKVCCCDRTGPPPGWRPDQDRLTILNMNTYLLEVRVIGPVNKKPNLEERASGIARWFNTLSEAEVPDVVVLTEILSWDAEEMIQRICSDLWDKNSGGDRAKFMPCRDSSKFGFATQQVNARGILDPLKGGGVVVLVKRGSEITAASDQEFSECASDDCLASKGFWAVQMLKGTQKYWVFATHAQAYGGNDNVAARRAQFKQMRTYADAHVENGARIVFSGDLNIFTGSYVDDDGNTVTQIETQDMLAQLGGPGVPATGGTVMPLGFWLRLDEPIEGSGGLPASADATKNHFIYNLPDERRLGSHMFDWNVVPSRGDRLAAPATAKFQVLPVKDTSCFGSDLVSGRSTDDLSDHNAVYSELCYASEGCPSAPALSGKRGVAGRLPAGPYC